MSYIGSLIQSGERMMGRQAVLVLAHEGEILVIDNKPIVNIQKNISDWNYEE